jgi:hypothetical protein
MNYPGHLNITELREIQKKIDDAAYATTAAAAMLSTTSDMANRAAIAAADAKAALDKVHTAAANKATESARVSVTSHLTATNPSIVATTAPEATSNNDNSTPLPTHPEENDTLSLVLTALSATLYTLLCIPLAAVAVLLTWKIGMFVRTAAPSLGFNDFHLMLFCSAFAVSFTTGVLLRARRRKVHRSWVWPGVGQGE